MRILPVICLLLIIPLLRAGAQIYERPNYSLSSHPTLEIVNIERWEDQMIVNMNLKNERFAGSFCIDSNTVLRSSLGEQEFNLMSMEGIPPCPELYRFRSVGERIDLSLVFEAVPDDIIYIDLVENCRENCVSIKYILLDEDMNNRINEGIRLYELGKPQAALQVFENIMSTEYDGLSPVFGTVYLYLISIHYELGNSKDARRVSQEFRASSIVGLEEFIETAKDNGIMR